MTSAVAPIELSTAALLQLRLANQGITHRDPGAGIVSITEHLLALQAQDFNQAVWALGVRVRGGTRALVDDALNSGAVVRSWPMRGTLHFVRPDDLRMILSLTAERSLSSIAKRRLDLGLDAATLGRARDIAADVLSGGAALGRTEFSSALEHAGVSTEGQRGPHLIGHLAQTGMICWGPRHGNQQAIVLLDEWAPANHEPSPTQALKTLVLRYFAGHGPATIADLSWWSKITLTKARQGLALAGDQLVALRHGGKDYWMGAQSWEATRDARDEKSVQLLPGFDEYLLGYQDRSGALAAENAPRIVPGNNGIFLPLIVSGGQIIGTWRREVSATRVLVKPLPFRRLLKRELLQVEGRAAEYGAFLGLPATMATIQE